MANFLPPLIVFTLLRSSFVLARFPFLEEATTAPFLSIGEFDYIIVGGGTAGCPLAATLSQKYKVLVLERGGSPYGNALVLRAEYFTRNLETDEPGSPSQTFYSTEGVLNARARILGGGSSINAGFYSRAQPSFINYLGFDQCLVEHSYRWVEKVLVTIPKLGPYQTAFRTALLQAGVVPDNRVSLEHLVGTKTGGSTFDNQDNRRPGSDLLVYANAANIKVLLHATVQKVLFREGSTVTIGVEFNDGLGQEHRVILSGQSNSEVIISAGALGSPQLLMLSGIGPGTHLTSKNITVVRDAPLVGQYMADNPSVRLFIPSPSPVELSLVDNVGVTSFGSYLEAGSGTPVSTIIPEAAIGAKVDGPLSYGWLFLNTTNADDNPVVTFNYFKVPRDLEVCVGGVNVAEETILAPAYRPFRYDTYQLPSGGTAGCPDRRNPRNTPSTINDRLAEVCLRNLTTMWHYHGGCLVDKVVDRGFKVLGMSGLRVIDASTFKITPGTNPQATILMLGRYMGLKIMEERTGVPIRCSSE